MFGGSCSVVCILKELSYLPDLPTPLTPSIAVNGTKRAFVAPLHQRSRSLCYLHDCSDCFRLERKSPGGGEAIPTEKRRLIKALAQTGLYIKVSTNIFWIRVSIGSVIDEMGVTC